MPKISIKDENKANYKFIILFLHFQTELPPNKRKSKKIIVTLIFD